MALNEIKFTVALRMDDELDSFFFGEFLEGVEKALLAMHPVETNEIRRGRETSLRKAAVIGPSELI